MLLQSLSNSSKRLYAAAIAVRLIVMGTVIALPQSASAAPEDDPGQPSLLAACPTTWEWELEQAPFTMGSTGDGGSLTVPGDPDVNVNDAEVYFSNLRNGEIATITSSNTAIARPGVGGQVAYTYLYASGMATLTATFVDSSCDPITLNLTVEPGAMPTASNSSTTVQENSSANDLPLSITGWDISSFDVTTPPSNGIAADHGTGISYTPNADFYGTDSFSYTVTNAKGSSAVATVTVTVAPISHIVSWTSTGPGSVGYVTFYDNPGTAVTSLVTVEHGQIISFWSPMPNAGSSFLTPTGCGIAEARSSWHTEAAVTDCEVVFTFVPITFASDVIEFAVAGTSFERMFSASGGAWDFTYLIDDQFANELPAGVQLAPDGTLSGASTETGTFSFTVRATNTRGDYQTQSFALTVGPAAVTPNPDPNPTPAVNPAPVTTPPIATLSKTGAVDSTLPLTIGTAVMFLAAGALMLRRRVR